ncbi:MAG: SsrA-binding protein SmpB [Patescibacteria group bacterium]
MNNIYSKNKKSLFDYEILETLEAGLLLSGSQTKSIKTNSIKLSGSFVSIHHDAAWLTNIHIPRYKYSNLENYNPDADIKLLLNKKEIAYLRGKIQEKGLTIVPISLYNKNRKIKLEIGIARGKKLYDKRRILREKSQKMEAAQILKSKTF